MQVKFISDLIDLACSLFCAVIASACSFGEPIGQIEQLQPFWGAIALRLFRAPRHV
jgi:hypothetical protein